MASSSHTYGPTCHLTSAVNIDATKEDDDVPHLKAQFFYSSPLPIDDPLSAVPPPSGSDTYAVKHPPRPFSAYDNNALEESWLGLSSESDRKYHHKASEESRNSQHLAQAVRRATIVKELATKHNSIHSRDTHTRIHASASISTNVGEQTQPSVIDPMDNKQIYMCCEELDKDARDEIGRGFLAAGKQQGNQTEHRHLVKDIMAEAELQRKGESLYDESLALQSDTSANIRSRSSNFQIPQYAQEQSSPIVRRIGKASAETKLENQTPHGKIHEYASRYEKSKQPKKAKLANTQSQMQTSNTSLMPNAETGTTGFPFARAPSRRGSPAPLTSGHLYSEDEEFYGTDDEGGGNHPSGSRRPGMGFRGSTTGVNSHACRAFRNSGESAEIPVGISRLHLVKLPSLQMMPIYWSPVHDIAAVTRGTWFYKDSMHPVEPAVANRLEMGYRELRPWSQTWRDELSSALEVGASGEEKITHRLWPKEESQTQEATSNVEYDTTARDPWCAARCFHGEAAAVGTVDTENPDEKTSKTESIVKRYPNSYVVYKDASTAFILKPSLQPSAYYGRRPLAKIKRGMTVGLPVVRGFDWKAWHKLYPPNKDSYHEKAEQNAPVSGSADAGNRSACAACKRTEERPKVTDLVFVIHGIGQKLSERVESFHFTHAVNSFRRSINVELGSNAVKNILRDDLGGVMVLPVNWRASLSFEEGGPMKAGDKIRQKTLQDDFTLKDITPDTIPVVRNLISDVMLDIPFYMSHHKPKMIQALINEANRVYRLWCRNNPEFHKEGRVHVIAHSLGSVMALEVLSKQPTMVPDLDWSKMKPSDTIQTKHFDFDTKNLFLVGSPAGFFLLLDRGRLMPRIGRTKPGSEPGSDQYKGVAGHMGALGCLAVDNIYNVMHYNDPIAYRLNAAVDASYASALRNAQVPSASLGFVESLAYAVRSITPGVSAAATADYSSSSSSAAAAAAAAQQKPATMRLPSQLEMEVHDFTREEIAEKKLFLLNDNGQVDWFMSSGGGPLEIQYLNMLGAHSSYWGSPDFVRMIVTEVGRKPGRAHALPNMRVVKAGPRKRAR